MFEAAAQKTYAFHKELSAKSNTEILEKLKGLMTVTILTPDQKKQFFEAAQPAYAQVRKDLGDALVDSFLKAVQDASK
jgi:TRAP-type C4-dicarboxylate transport system substrate-binding protein